MGMWYGIEVIDHHEREEIQEIEPNQCIIFHLTELEALQTTQSPHYNNRNRNHRHQDETHYLKLTWREQDTTLEYGLKFNNSRRGYWTTAPTPKTTIIDVPSNQFLGIVQVMKAIGNQLVLTFCQATPDNRLYTIVLARQPASLAAEVRKFSIYFSLYIITVRKEHTHTQKYYIIVATFTNKVQKVQTIILSNVYNLSGDNEHSKLA